MQKKQNISFIYGGHYVTTFHIRAAVCQYIYITLKGPETYIDSQ